MWLGNWVETWKLGVKQHCTEDTASLDPPVSTISVKNDRFVFKDTVGALRATWGLRALPMLCHLMGPGCPRPAQLHGRADPIHCIGLPACPLAAAPLLLLTGRIGGGTWRCGLGCRWRVVGQQTQPAVCRRQAGVTDKLGPYQVPGMGVRGKVSCTDIKLEKISLKIMWVWLQVTVIWEEGKGLSLDMLLKKLQSAEMAWMRD